MSTEKIAHFVVDTSYENIPQEALTMAKQAILDCLGVTIAACNEPGCRVLSEYVKEDGGNPEAGVVGRGFKALAAQAAWINGTMAHVLDYDDWSTLYIGHPTVAILPAILALGEKHNISGKEALLSYIIGFEVGAKIGIVVCRSHYLIGWHTTCTLGTLGAVAAAARILKLDVEETRMAFGIAASLAGGLKQNFGTMTKSFHAGNAARNGIVAARLAQKGFTAQKSILETPQGFCKVFAGGADLDLENIADGLGERFDVISGLVLKPWPSCGGTHTIIEGTLHLREQYNIRPEEVEEVEILTNPAVRTATIHSRPQAGLEGKFSNEYCVARALLDGAVGLEDFTDERVCQPEAQELLRKVKYIDPEETETQEGSEVKVKLRDGKSFSHRVSVTKGSAQNPLSWKEISTKYKDCASSILSSADVDTCLDMVSNLESLPAITSLMDILTFRGKQPVS
ncbi:MAG: MmgE/PrpD family protein [Thermodesulfobacteriota bacterium]|nr:MmgE/PrpD family protein [Thermodesulfobacteriota bacterium]